MTGAGADRFDAVVVGGGPGGYVAAIRLAQLGRRTALVEQAALGGTCLNWGCIPSKALLAAAGLADELRGAAERGIVAEGRVDLSRLRSFKEEVVRKLVQGITQLERGNGVEVVRGRGALDGPRAVAVSLDGGGTRRLEAEAIVLATGASPLPLPGFPVDGRDVWGPREALELSEIPGRLAVIGGGVIGCELSTAYAKLGSRVTVVEALPGILGVCDPEAVRLVMRGFRLRGVEVRVDARALGFTRGPAGLAVQLERGGRAEALEVDRILVAIGFGPAADGLGLEAAGVQRDRRGFVAVDARGATNVPSIFAVGDLAGPPLLAHKASREGELVAEAIAGAAEPRRWRAMPSAVFTDPEVAHVGLLEADAEAQGIEVTVGKSHFGALGRALAMGRGEGFVKVVAERTGGRILGVSMAGPEVSDLVAEAALAVELGATLDAVARTVHAHPTLAEGFMEACKAALGASAHAVPRSPRSRQEGR